VTEEAGSGQEGLALLGRNTYDLMILDMRMPGVDGLGVIGQVHAIAPGLPIIVLTGHATLESAIAAVRSEEVVEYLLKPTSVHDVASAVSAALQKHAARQEKERLVQVVSAAVDKLRRGGPGQLPSGQPTSASRDLEVGALRLDRQKRLVSRVTDPGQSVELTEGETAILEQFMTRPDQVFTCSELARGAWGFSMSEAEAQGIIRSTIFRLRHKVEVDPDRPAIIRTVRGRGYFLAFTREE
jgi:DNA-binding response OmpR family regulator